MFHHPLTKNSLKFFLRLDTVNDLETLTFSTVAGFDNNKILGSVEEVLHSLNRNEFAVFRTVDTVRLLRPTLGSDPLAENKHQVGLRPHYGKV